MYPKISVNLGNLILSLSDALDLAFSSLAMHQQRTAFIAWELGKQAKLEENRIEHIFIAGLLHDLGKLVIPNAILEKPAGLTHAEMAVMKQHTYYTFTVLSTIGGLKMIAEWAAYHHERLDGKGYPFKRNAHEMTLGARIMAVSDIFTAVAEDRPYRNGMPAERIKTILQNQADGGIQDARIVKLLLENIDEIRRSVMEEQKQARQYYESAVTEIK
ncbi:MAG: HD domain-containing protein [Proteobacteria bacterium]|nr:HD domain-containing protein [Pseudomonadota bacterium]MBU4581948.1 HD domain-containing protein [Pseudomonadota bacterium]MCG2739744.1 HD domain-containing protein [Syntrophaceae bacterium]